jgi:hypothetical protein
VILAHHKDHLAPRPPLNGVQRNGQAIVLGRQYQLHIDKCAWPQPALQIRKLGFEPDRARARIGLIVDQEKLTGIELRFIVLAESDGFRLASRQSVLNLRYTCRGEREDHADRLYLGDHD